MPSARPRCSQTSWADEALSVVLGSGPARAASAALASTFYPAAALMAAHGALAVSWQCQPPGRSRQLAGWAACASVVFIRLVLARSLSLVNPDLSRQAPNPACLTPAREAATHLAQIASPSDLLLPETGSAVGHCLPAWPDAPLPVPAQDPALVAEALSAPPRLTRLVTFGRDQTQARSSAAEIRALLPQDHVLTATERWLPLDQRCPVPKNVVLGGEPCANRLALEAYHRQMP